MNNRTAAMPPEEGIGATRISLYCSEERAEISSDLECSGVKSLEKGSRIGMGGI